MKGSLESDTVLILSQLSPLHSLMLYVLKIFSCHLCSTTRFEVSTFLIMLSPNCFTLATFSTHTIYFHVITMISLIFVELYRL